MAQSLWALWMLAMVTSWLVSRNTAMADRPTAMFIFGDSLVDVGMNNNVPSLARANYRPNGIDYPGGVPTGRFCNGRLISDFLSEYWRIPPALAYDDPANMGETLLNGANFASAGAGILNDTGMVFNKRFPMDQQVDFFREHKEKLIALVGTEEASRILAGASVSITIGSNDFLSNYFIPISPRRARYTLPEYINLLIPELKRQVMSIYEIGARKIVVAGVGPLGCIPFIIAMRFGTNQGRCVEKYQQIAMDFNARLVSLVQELQETLTDATFLYSNAFDLSLQLIQNPALYGFTTVNKACCGRGPYGGLIACNRFDPVCPDRTKYVFWDPFHPTEAVNRLVSQQLLFGPPSVISPMNLSQLFA
ncbi:hypothetical protein KP509_27G065900 [Ceratopteris richardii]|uniref:Uncharacterized protein n=2 Tax=Ceratopteris richardii TaxID=49495 RepID=A0A8T2RHB5_CERRI|nr:hypothetical protein KP509_27G065900 [Ceratopteris richardii]